MSNFKIEELFRYIISGLLALLIVYLIKPCFFNVYIKPLGDLWISLATLSFGVLYYQFYHAIIYRFIMISLKDCIKKQNIRKYIMDNYDGLNKWNAENFYYLIRETCFQENERKYTHFGGAGIHLLYMCSILLFIGAIWVFINCCHFLGIIFIAGGIITYLIGLLNDLTLENKEHAFFIHLEKSGKYFKVIRDFHEAYKKYRQKDTNES